MESVLGNDFAVNNNFLLPALPYQISFVQLAGNGTRTPSIIFSRLHPSRLVSFSSCQTARAENPLMGLASHDGAVVNVDLSARHTISICTPQRKKLAVKCSSQFTVLDANLKSLDCIFQFFSASLLIDWKIV